MAELDDYLDRLSRQLQASPEEAAEVVREIRSHLELAVLDMERNGDEEATCLARALERFGEAECIGQELRQVHGRATWAEATLAALPMLLFGTEIGRPQLPVWLGPQIWQVWKPALLAVAIAAAWRTGWPLWWWAWLGWLPLVIPSMPGDLLWVAVAYAVILLLVSRRDWLEATLAIFPLPTAWAFHSLVLASDEVRSVGWSGTTLELLGLGMALAWAALLVRTLRTPSGTARIWKVLEGQAIVFLLNGLTAIVARLWPTHPFPYPFTWRYFLSVTVPCVAFKGLPFVLFFVLTSLPAVLALVQTHAHRQPPSRPIWNE